MLDNVRSIDETSIAVQDGEVFVVGDLHISDVFEGKHKDYLGNCMEVMENLCSMIEERNPSIVVLLGDIIGCNETNIKSREVLDKVLGYFVRMNKVAKVLAVRGNHDIAGYPDFTILKNLNLITIVDHLDYYHANKVEARFHFVHYGEEHRDLQIVNAEEIDNVVFGHQDYMIDGVTTWYPPVKGGVELTTLTNFNDVSLVISGHIHTPSPELVMTTMPSGKECGLFYVGCPTRPVKEMDGYEQVWYMSFNYKEDMKAVDYDFLPIDLKPCDEIYYVDESIVSEKTQDELDEEVRKENLKQVLSDVMEYRVLRGDYLSQIDKIPEASQEAKAMAKNYITMVQNGERTA